jgi:hypothetical protein
MALMSAKDLMLYTPFMYYTSNWLLTQCVLDALMTSSVSPSVGVSRCMRLLNQQFAWNKQWTWAFRKTTIVDHMMYEHNTQWLNGFVAYRNCVFDVRHTPWERLLQCNLFGPRYDELHVNVNVTRALFRRSVLLWYRREWRLRYQRIQHVYVHIVHDK